VSSPTTFMQDLPSPMLPTLIPLNPGSVLSLDSRIYTVATIRYRREHVPLDSKQDQMHTQRKHVRLMDQISLLLVTEPGSDVAATSLEIRPDGCHIVFAKNRRCNKRENKFIAKLKELLSPSNRPDKSKLEAWSDETTYTINGLVVSNCHEKIWVRLNRMKEDVRAVGDLHTALRNPPPQTAADIGHRRQSIEGGPWHQADISEDELSCLVKIHIIEFHMDMATWSKTMFEENWFKLLYNTWSIGHAGDIEKVFDIANHETKLLLDCLRKLGDYYAAVQNLMVSTLASLSSDQQVHITELTGNPERGSITLEGPDPLHLLNKWAEYSQKPPVTAEEICMRFPEVHEQSLVRIRGERLPMTEVAVNCPTSVPDIKVDSCAHAECTVVMHLLTRGDRYPSWIEVGVSKSVCWSCHQFFLAIERVIPTKILFSTLHGKIYPGWQLPISTDRKLDEALRTAMEKIFDSELDNILEKVYKRRRHDSNPLNSDPIPEATEVGVVQTAGYRGKRRVFSGCWMIENLCD